MSYTVPTASIVMMVICMLAGLVMPVALLVVFWRKYKCSPVAFFVGAGVMLVFALILEQILHMIVLYHPTLGPAITGNIFLYGLYGALAAGVFEETGRFVAFKTVLRKRINDDKTALMYGAGHGGFEVAYILILGMFSNLTVAMLMNGGMTDMLFVGATGDVATQIESQLLTLVETPWYMYLVSIVERGAAVIAQISLSVFVWFGAKKNIGFFPLAIFLHFLLDFVVVVVNGLTGKIWLVETLCWIMALVYAYGAWKLYHIEK